MQAEQAPGTGDPTPGAPPQDVEAVDPEPVQQVLG